MKKLMNKDLGKIRRELGRKSIKTFAQIYFKNYLENPMCSFHEDLYKTLYEMTAKRDQREAIAAPRNSAKSSISNTIYTAWSICYGTEDFIIILSDVKSKAVDHLNSIKHALETNDLLRSDFPEIFASKPKRWANDEIMMASGVRVVALGSCQKIRGKRKGHARPSLIIIDDIENEVNTATVEAREKLFNWFTKAVLKAGTDKTNFVVIGTILHFDSLLAKLTDDNKMPGWNKFLYKSVISWAIHQDLWQKWSAIFNYREDYMGKRGKEAAFVFFSENKDKMLEGTQVLWPERESYYDLMVMREQDGENSFDTEKQNSPVNLKDCTFNPDEFHYYDDDFKSEGELLSTIDTTLLLFGGCDPATGESTARGDYSAVITIGLDSKTGIMYVLDADIAKRNPDSLVETILSYCQIRRYSTFAIESNGFQELIQRELERRAAQKHIYAPVEGIKNTSDKVTRIFSLQPYIKSGYLRFSRRHTVLLEQLRYFPKGRFDDGPDALELACRIAREPGIVKAMII